MVGSLNRFADSGLTRCAGIMILIKTWVLVLVITLSCCACAGPSYQLKHIAKSDIDLVADAHLQEQVALVKRLMAKLYRRNPGELKKTPGYTIKQRQQQLFRPNAVLTFTELNSKQGTDAMLLSFSSSYDGDRVFALTVGLLTMIYQSYNNQREFYLFDSLDQQKLYNSARNIEILVWRLKKRTGEDGQLLLLTNGRRADVENLSFERLFGKMIALQDMMARITADKTNRTINKVVHRIASAAFLPVGI